eukprot:ANDGO_08542.mRNA.1 hypothetical protein
MSSSFEENLDEQCRGDRPYDFPTLLDAVRSMLVDGTLTDSGCLLSSIPTISKVFTLALAALPEPHFSLVRCLMPSAVVDSDAGLTSLSSACDAFEKADFPTAWTLLAAAHPPHVAALEASLRAYVVDVMARTCVSLPASEAAAMLGLKTQGSTASSDDAAVVAATITAALATLRKRDPQAAPSAGLKVSTASQSKDGQQRWYIRFEGHGAASAVLASSNSENAASRRAAPPVEQVARAFSVLAKAR